MGLDQHWFINHFSLIHPVTKSPTYALIGPQIYILASQVTQKTLLNTLLKPRSTPFIAIPKQLVEYL